MAERSWMVGSLPECDIRVENSAVSGRHCRLTQRGESLLLEDLDSTNGTFVAGERVSGPRIVRRGDPVTLGRSTPLPWPPVIRSVTIGRLPDNDIVIPLDMISGQHARLEQEGDTVYLIDLGSKNGTAVTDPLNKITRAAIQPTDRVFFGTHRVAAWELLKALPNMLSVTPRHWKQAHRPIWSANCHRLAFALIVIGQPEYCLGKDSDRVRVGPGASASAHCVRL